MSMCRIYTFEKNVVCDDETAIVGTINMDFRSFYLHFENGVWLCGTDSVFDIKKDFLETLDMCREITMKSGKRPCTIDSSSPFCMSLHPCSSLA